MSATPRTYTKIGGMRATAGRRPERKPRGFWDITDVDKAADRWLRQHDPSWKPALPLNPPFSRAK